MLAPRAVRSFVLIAMHTPSSGGGLNPFTGSIIYPLLKDGTMGKHVASVRATLADRKVCARNYAGVSREIVPYIFVLCLPITRIACAKPWHHTCRQVATSTQAMVVISYGSGYQALTSCSWQIPLGSHTRSRTLPVCYFCPIPADSRHNIISERACTAGSKCSVGGQYKDCMRLSFAYYGKDTLTEGVRRLAAMLRDTTRET